MPDLASFPSAMPLAGVPNAILMDSGIREAVGATDGPKATVRFLTNWGDRYTFINNVVGTAILSGSSIIRIDPQPYPPSPNIYAIEVPEVVGIGKPTRTASGWISYPYAAITIGFGIPPWLSDVAGMPYTQTTITHGNEFYTVPDSVYLFADGTPTMNATGIQIPTIDLQFRRHRMPMSLSLLAQINTLQGYVNNGTFLGFAAGTLLFNGASAEESSDVGGNRTYSLDYSFTFRYIPHNYELHPNRTTGWAAVSDGSGNMKHSAADFSVLP
jgi:hypothetical protein